MGCSCSRGKNTMIEIIVPEPKKAFIIRVLSDPITLATLKSEHPYSHCNVLIWTEQAEDFATLFPKAFVKYSPVPDFPMTFNLISSHSDPTLRKSVIDALIFIVKKEEQIEKIKEISELNTNICIQISISELKITNLPGIIHIQKIEDLYETLFEQQFNLEKLLRGVFSDLDENYDGFITDLELTRAMIRLDSKITTENIDTVISKIDNDKDGKVSFNEFSYWWKRGRQGGISLNTLVESWGEYIKTVLPRMNRNSEKKSIDKSKLKKKITINLKKKTNFPLQVSIRAGKSAKREEILRAAEQKLGVNIYEFWFAVILTGKSESQVCSSLRIFDEVLAAIKFVFLANTVQGQDLNDSIAYHVLNNADELFLCFSCEVNDEIINESLASLDSLEKTLISPVDDYVSIDLKSEKTLMDHAQSPGTNLLDSIGSGQITIDAEHWSSFGNMIHPSNNFQEILKKFTMFEGETQIADPEFSDLEPLIQYFRKILKPVTDLRKNLYLFNETFRVISENYKQQFTFLLRYMNLGVEIKASCPDLVTFITSL